MAVRERTQFAVALVGSLGLVVLTGIAIVIDQDKQIISMLIGGLISVTSLAGAWLFKGGSSS